MDGQGQEGSLHVCADLEEDKEEGHQQGAHQDLTEEAGARACLTRAGNEGVGRLLARPRGNPLVLVHT